MKLKAIKLPFFRAGLALGACLVSSYGQQPPTEGLQLWLKADAGIAKTEAGLVTGWTDQSPNQHVAAPTAEESSPLFVETSINNKPAVRFDGAAALLGDFLEIPSSPSIEIGADITTFFVVRFDDLTGYNNPWAKTDGNAPASTDFYTLPSSGIPRAYRGDGTLPNARSVDGTVRLKANTPVVYGFSQSETILTHYFNGQPAGSGEITTPIADTGAPLRIGTRGDNFTKMKGDISEILIYNRALTPAEITTLGDYLKQKYNILNEAPTVVLTSPANNASQPAPATFQVTANVSDPDSAIARVEFFLNGLLVGTATSAPYSLPILVETMGEVTIGVEAVDVKDARSTRASVTVNATDSGNPGALPTNPELALWLSADRGVTADESGFVSQWDDASGRANHALAGDPGWTPMLVDGANGKKTIRFDGSDDSLEVAHSEAITLDGDLASFAVVRVDDYDGFRAVWAKTEGNQPRPFDWYFVAGSGGVSRIFRGNNDANAMLDAVTRLPANTFAIVGFNHKDGVLTQYMNGSPNGSTGVSLVPFDAGTPLRIGTRADFVTYMKGDISEVVIYDGGLSSTDLTAVHKYFGDKYGIPWAHVANPAPSVQLTAPAGGEVVTVPAVVSMTATAEDAGGSISRVEFLANGGLVATDTSAPFEGQFTATVGGEIVLTAVAYDNFGNRAVSPGVIITANAPDPMPIPGTGLALWLRGDKGVTADNNGVVTGWEDFSGNFNHARNADLSSAPMISGTAVNNKPALIFDGVNDQLEISHSTSLAITGDITTLFVVNFDDFATYRAVWAKTAGNEPRPNDWYTLPDSGIPQVIRGSPNVFAPAEGPLPAGQYIIAGYDQVGTTITHYLDGGVLSTFESPVASFQDGGASTYIGTRGDLFTRMKGAIAEILVYNRSLSGQELEQVNSYLKTRYAIGGAQPDPVSLSVSREGASVVISWPATAENFELEGTIALGTAWGPVSGTSTVDNGTVKVTLTPTEATQFFRLKK